MVPWFPLKPLVLVPSETAGNTLSPRDSSIRGKCRWKAHRSSYFRIGSLRVSECAILGALSAGHREVVSWIAIGELGSLRVCGGSTRHGDCLTPYVKLRGPERSEGHVSFND